MSPSANRTMSHLLPPHGLPAGNASMRIRGRRYLRWRLKPTFGKPSGRADFFGFCQLIAFSALVAAADFRLGIRHGRMGVKSKLQSKSVYRRSAWLAAPLA